MLLFPMEPLPPVVPLRDRYCEAVKHEWSPRECRAHWGLYNRFQAWVRQEIRLWYDDYGRRFAKHDCLTALAWHIADQAYNRRITGWFLDFSDHKQRFYLAPGFLEFCKLICRDVEKERQWSRPLVGEGSRAEAAA